ncbi:hypothetical protein [Rhodobacter sp. SY28-1]|uniref:hypothetical protein n=1 Tax=Rhodobacter sp. SY28-1 TaxID=2562317 RepID=UPI0010BFA3C0|nr:hypothetical protein [Rhodobacter sp. SY28-1]
MTITAILRLHRAALFALVTLALVATGFAHRMPSQQDEALAFVLATGASLADICGDDLGGNGNASADCLACQITGAADLPSAALSLIDLDLAFHAAVIAPREAVALARAQGPAHRPQGPPVA